MPKVTRQIENSFPFGEVSKVAEQESWRKDIYRPLSYIHKWWARRLGSVFREIIIDSAEKKCNASAMQKFYANTKIDSKIVMDPFMGSGTTIVEAIKLGASAIGFDINPISALMVATALKAYSEKEVKEAFYQLQVAVEDKIKHYYRTVYEGQEVDVLYYFWVHSITCSDCGVKVDLFKDRIFSKNAYPKKKPLSQSVCPDCGAINEVHYLAESATCHKCGSEYNPQIGNVEGRFYICPSCGKKEPVVDWLRKNQNTLEKHMYAKVVATKTGGKIYLPITSEDIELYNLAETELSAFSEFMPTQFVAPGVNTKQILNYNYKQWYQLFNTRQLLSFAILAKYISQIQDENTKQLFAVLFSGTLEFNNMLCSFKGEGTGAIRPIFYNHILKPEYTPVEGNVWGTPNSSGAFSTLFQTRILRALAYKARPFEIKIDNGKTEKIYLDCSIECKIASSFSGLSPVEPMVECRDSSNTGLLSKSVDLVVTDPPFFDNVNYSELADFFYVWLTKLNLPCLGGTGGSTRSSSEVQDASAEKFECKLNAVFSECCRVLKDDGLLVFTYHHSKLEGWTSVYNAVANAGFTIVQTYPVKAEMSVSVTIQSAKEPINYDLIFVCKKQNQVLGGKGPLLSVIQDEIKSKISELTVNELALLKGDKMVIAYGSILEYISQLGLVKLEEQEMERIFSTIEFE